MSNDCSGDEELARRLQMEENYRGLLLRNSMPRNRVYTRAPSKLKPNTLAGDPASRSTPDAALGHVRRAIRDGAEWMLGLPSMILRNLRMYPLDDFNEFDGEGLHANLTRSRARTPDEALAHSLQEQELAFLQQRDRCSRRAAISPDGDTPVYISRASARERLAEASRVSHPRSERTEAARGSQTPLLDRSILHRLVNDEMTYEDMLALQEALGSVSRGASEGQISRLPFESFEPATGKGSGEEATEVGGL